MMTANDMKRDRIAVLEMYLEQRQALKESIYRLLKSAAEVRVGPEEFKTLSEALNLVKDDDGPWAVRREIDDLKGKNSR